MHFIGTTLQASTLQVLTRLWLVLLMLCTLAACDTPEPSCIQADDWGYPKIWVSSEKDELTVSGSITSQYAEWIDSGQVISKNSSLPLIFALGDEDDGDANLSRWTSWYNGVSSVVPYDKVCTYYENNACPLTEKAQSGDCDAINNPDDYADCYVPCWYHDGYGLYAYFKSDSTDVTKHLGDTDGDGYLLTENAAALSVSAGDRIYFKILDLYYDDNKDGYLVHMKSGTEDAGKGPLEKLVAHLTAPVDKAMESIYNGIINNAGFIRVIELCLVLYITLYGLSFILGMKGTQTYGDLVMSTIKIGLVIQLISPSGMFTESSWDFFYNHLFRFFIDGPLEIGALAASAVGPYDVDNPWYSLDHLLKMFLASETQQKIWSLLFSNGLGFLFIPALYVVMGLFIFALLKALVVYLVAYFIIAILVIVFPIFLLFMLFGLTSDLFREWLAQMAAAMLQQIILFTALGMFSTIIIYYLYQTLGFRICWKTVFDFSLGSIDIWNFKFWLPDIRSTQGTLFLDTNGDLVPETVTRYIDLPYLDITLDADKIADMRSEHDFISFFDIVIFAIVNFLMLKFMDLVPTLSNSMKGGVGRSADSANILTPGLNTYGTLVELTAGKEGSGDSLTKDASNPGSKAFYKYVGRDGGLLGSFMRGSYSFKEGMKGLFSNDSASEEKGPTTQRQGAFTSLANRALDSATSVNTTTPDGSSRSETSTPGQDTWHTGQLQKAELSAQKQKQRNQYATELTSIRNSGSRSEESLQRIRELEELIEGLDSGRL